MNSERLLNKICAEDDEYLELIRNLPNMQDSFGISQIQKMMRIGYNRAAHLVERAIDSNLLVKDPTHDYLVKFNN